MKKLNFTLVHKKNEVEKKMMEFHSKRAQLASGNSSSSQLIFNNKKLSLISNSPSILPEVKGEKKTSHEKRPSPNRCQRKRDEDKDGKPDVKIVE